VGMCLLQPQMLKSEERSQRERERGEPTLGGEVRKLETLRLDNLFSSRHFSAHWYCAHLSLTSPNLKPNHAQSNFYNVRIKTKCFTILLQKLSKTGGDNSPERKGRRGGGRCGRK